MIKKTLFLVLAYLMSFIAVQGQYRFESYALHQVNLVDVNQGKVIENQTIVIHQDLIVGIYDADTFQEDDTIQLLNFKGHFVSPGLIDAHVHLGTDPSGEKFVLPICTIFKIEDGLITEDFTYYDNF